MARVLKYIGRFQSLGGDVYEVRISREGHAGGVTELVCAENPLTTSEDASSDIFTPVRKHTGYFRVIDHDGSLSREIFPRNNTENYVEVLRGTFEGGVFTPAETAWRGFLQAQSYSQPWDGQSSVLELPLKSVGATLADVRISTSLSASKLRVARIILDAFASIGVQPTMYTFITSLGSISSLLHAFIECSIFFRKEETVNEGDIFTEVVGNSYYDVISSILKLFGLQMREKGSEVIFAQYDGAEGEIIHESFTPQDMGQFAGGVEVMDVDAYLIPSVPLIGNVEWRGENNTTSTRNGSSIARVTLRLDDGVGLEMTPPQASELDTLPQEVSDIFNAQVFVQPQTPRGGLETFTFSEYRQQGASASVRVGASTYPKCLANCVINRPLYDPHYSSEDNLHTGAFPCRFFYRERQTDSPALRGGIFFNQQYLSDGWSFTPYYCYSLRSELPYTYKRGYIRIDMTCLNFMRGWLAGDRDKLYFGDYQNIWAESPKTKLYFILTWGNSEWDGTQWVTHSGDYKTFTIDFNGDTVVTNKTAEMRVEESGGYFIPINGEMSGNLRLYILNVSSTEEAGGYRDAHSRIITDLVLEYLDEIPLTASRRRNNVYMLKMLANGFTGESNISLNLGTFNNNINLPCFITDRYGGYVETAEFRKGNGMVSRRLETNLLERLSAYNNVSRISHKGVIANNLDVINKKYTYGGRSFFSVMKNNDWRENRAEVDFFEV